MDTHEEYIAAGKFKAECLGLISKAQHEKTSVVITKRGKAVARLVPYDTEDGGDQPLFGALSGSVTVSGDIVAPTGEAWDAES